MERKILKALSLGFKIYKLKKPVVTPVFFCLTPFHIQVFDKDVNKLSF